MKLEKITNYLLLLFIFLIPWHTRYIYLKAELNGGVWEYGTLSLFGTELLLWLIVILFGINKFGNKKIWHKMSSKQHFKHKWKNLAVALAFLIFLALLIVNSINSTISYQHALWIMAGICIGLVIIEKSTQLKEKMLLTLWASGIVQGLLAIGQFFTQKVIGCKWLGMSSQHPSDVGVSIIQHIDQRWMRVYGSFGWPNSLGLYLAVIFVLGLIIMILVLRKKTLDKISKVHKYIYLFGQFTILSGLLLTFSRGAWLSALFGIALLFIILIQYKKKEIITPKLLRLFGWQLFMYLVYILVIVIFLAPLFQARFNLINSVEKVSVQEHKAQYSESAQVISRNLFLGTGPGTYTLFLYKQNPRLKAWQYQPAHNIFVLWLAEMGIVGLMVFGFLFTWLFYLIYKYNKLFLPLVVVLLIHGVFDHWLWTLYSGIIFWWVVWALSIKNRFVP